MPQSTEILMRLNYTRGWLRGELENPEAISLGKGRLISLRKMFEQKWNQLIKSEFWKADYGNADLHLANFIIKALPFNGSSDLFININDGKDYNETKAARLGFTALRLEWILNGKCPPVWYQRKSMVSEAEIDDNPDFHGHKWCQGYAGHCEDSLAWRFFIALNIISAKIIEERYGRRWPECIPRMHGCVRRFEELASEMKLMAKDPCLLDGMRSWIDKLPFNSLPAFSWRINPRHSLLWACDFDQFVSLAKILGLKIAAQKCLKYGLDHPLRVSDSPKKDNLDRSKYFARGVPAWAHVDSQNINSPSMRGAVIFNCLREDVISLFGKAEQNAACSTNLCSPFMDIIIKYDKKMWPLFKIPSETIPPEDKPCAKDHFWKSLTGWDFMVPKSEALNVALDHVGVMLMLERPLIDGCLIDCLSVIVGETWELARKRWNKSGKKDPIPNVVTWHFKNGDIIELLAKKKGYLISDEQLRHYLKQIIKDFQEGGERPGSPVTIVKRRLRKNGYEGISITRPPRKKFHICQIEAKRIRT